ncbi:diaminobutyrate acetyltransferase [Nesterenkonia lutea]|uniref:L-2,4-diaminobutyric acid acetyltransferase n=1 Tax=Nesterenkonia lutea TaxID=272919 RepID=A0ABR9JGN7_9MICC|nr:diaminobutyrate acetyltransferase [Nesterenkonia lutea]MBE1525092.1 L-2,4-diaminobutyric acid acetyltransferase [Nesterenkonia lutea]
MPHTADTPAQNSAESSPASERVEIRTPTVADGASLWRLAAGTGVLDVNTPYAYILWTRDFAETSVIAEVEGEPAGFISGYRRPEDPQTLFIWQVAVDSRFRGRRLASRMLTTLVEAVAPQRLETTITADNAASIALFTGLARDKGAEITTTRFFTEKDFPSAEESGEQHAPEDLYTVAPLGPNAD